MRCECIFDEECIDKWLLEFPDQTCPNCRMVFEKRPVGRMLRDLMLTLTFKCKLCESPNELRIDQRIQHWKVCERFQVGKCPIADGCDKHGLGSYQELMLHIQEECESKFLDCEACGYPVYRMYTCDEYNGRKKGHNCVRDLIEQHIDIYERAKQQISRDEKQISDLKRQVDELKKS